MPGSSNRLLLLTMLLDLILVSLVFATLNCFSPAGIIPCTEPRAGHLFLALSLGSITQLFFLRSIPSVQFRALLGGQVVLTLMTLWLGVYAISPRGYASGQIPNLRGFLIIRANRSSTVNNNEVVSMRRGSAVGINSLLLDEASQCTWISAAGAALDDPSSCDTAYVPPNADHDILRLRIRSSCGLPDTTGQIRVSILP